MRIWILSSKSSNPWKSAKRGLHIFHTFWLDICKLMRIRIWINFDADPVFYLMRMRIRMRIQSRLPKWCRNCGSLRIRIWIQNTVRKLYINVSNWREYKYCELFQRKTLIFSGSTVCPVLGGLHGVLYLQTCPGNRTGLQNANKWQSALLGLKNSVRKDNFLSTDKSFCYFVLAVL